MSQLRQFKGNLNRILEQIGGEEPPTNESPPSKIRIEWKNRILWVTPYQLLRSEGNLSKLEETLYNSGPRPRWTFQKKYVPVTKGDHKSPQNYE